MRLRLLLLVARRCVRLPMRATTAAFFGDVAFGKPR
jgi:hypothetical protein